jgi:hypothetical protein
MAATEIHYSPEFDYLEHSWKVMMECELEDPAACGYRTLGLPEPSRLPRRNLTIRTEAPGSPTKVFGIIFRLKGVEFHDDSVFYHFCWYLSTMMRQPSATDTAH